MTVEAFLTCENGRHPVTIQLNSNMIAPALAGATVIGRANVDGSTRTMSWVSATLVSDGVTLMTATAVFRNPPSAERAV
jgi:acyl-CoA thioesterase